MAREQRIEILAEMVANVLVVEVAVGDSVDIGDTVVLLESMKMEIPVMAEAAGTVTAVKVAAGDVVQEGDPLVELDREPRQQRGRDSNPRLTSLPATAFKAVPIGHSGTPPWPRRRGVTTGGESKGDYSEPPISCSTSS